MASKPQPLVVAEQDSNQREFVTDPAWFAEQEIVQPDGSIKKVLPNPTFTVQEAAKFFFGKSPDWLRWRTKKTDENPQGFFVLDGVPLPDHRTDAGFRYYTLHDIEMMAHALAQQQGIDGGTLQAIVTLVRTECRIYGYI